MECRVCKAYKGIHQVYNFYYLPEFWKVFKRLNKFPDFWCWVWQRLSSVVHCFNWSSDKLGVTQTLKRSSRWIFLRKCWKFWCIYRRTPFWKLRFSKVAGLKSTLAIFLKTDSRTDILIYGLWMIVIFKILGNSLRDIFAIPFLIKLQPSINRWQAGVIGNSTIRIYLLSIFTWPYGNLGFNISALAFKY